MPHDHANHDHDHAEQSTSGARTQARVRESYRVSGMDCAEEVAVLRRELGPLLGGENHLGFDVLKGRMTVLEGAEEVRPETLLRAVARTGMRAERWEDQAPPERAARSTGTLLAAASGAATAAGFGLHAFLGGGVLAALGAGGRPPIAACAVYAVGIAAGLALVLPKALFAARRLRPDMNLLMTLAVAGALALGDWLEAATVTFLFAVSLALERWSVGRARRAVEALMSLSPPVARVQRGGAEIEVDPAEVAAGERIVVRPGERIPLDGLVVSGASDVDQAPITGESVPVAKAAGAEVFAGTVNGDGALVVETTRASTDTTLARISKAVADAQARRGPSEQWVERFSAWYTPIVLASAALVVAVPVLLGGDPAAWLYRALVLLVIGCPCSLVISTPVTIVAALASAARHGVLLKGGAFVELPASLRAVALDKTGTLTEGRPRVAEVVPLAEHDERELLERAHALALRSDHPLSRAMIAHAQELGIAALPVEDYRIVQGKGAHALVGGRRYWLGSHRYLEERGQETPDVHDRLEAMTATGRSAVVIGNEEHVCGLIALADGVRPEALDAVLALRREGIERVVMLTGDNRATAEAVAKSTGVDDVRAELLPEDKVAVIEALVAEHGRVAMVGDGVNDAPALARASLGVAMGAAGSDVALETADVALMGDDLSKLAWLVGHSRRAVAVVRQNIVFSLGVKATFVVLALLGWSSLWLAIAADMGASLLVTLNGLRLLRDPALPPARVGRADGTRDV